MVLAVTKTLSLGAMWGLVSKGRRLGHLVTFPEVLPPYQEL